MQQAFIDHGAVQCGFCIPGMILAGKALLDRKPKPSRERIREAIAGNLCRCTGYTRIVDAIEAASNAGQPKSDPIRCRPSPSTAHNTKRTTSRRNLLSYLRFDLGLTGSKYGCGEGLCGACTVLVDGRPLRSCMSSVGAVAGGSITTIEGLAKNGVLHPVQQAFVDEVGDAVRVLHARIHHVGRRDCSTASRIRAPRRCARRSPRTCAAAARTSASSARCFRRRRKFDEVGA